MSLGLGIESGFGVDWESSARVWLGLGLSRRRLPRRDPRNAEGGVVDACGLHAP